MEAIIVSHGSKVRCYKCGSTEVTSICHHCGRPMCSKHGPVKPSLGWFAENREFTKLSLRIWPLNNIEGVHCEEHIHSTVNFRRVMILPGVLIALLGVALLVLAAIPFGNCLLNLPVTAVISDEGFAEVLRDPAIYTGIQSNACFMPAVFAGIVSVLQAVLVLAFGVGVMIVGRRLDRESVEPDAVKQGITLPFGPITRKIRIVEKIHSTIQIDEHENARAKILNEIEGKIDPSFAFTSWDIKRVKEYKTKYHIKDDQDLAFQAGYLLLEGAPHIGRIYEVSNGAGPRSSDEARDGLGRNPLLKIDGRVKDHAVLTETTGKSNLVWNKRWGYTVMPQAFSRSEELDKTGTVPVWILPVVFERGNSKELTLMVQLNVNYFPLLSEVLAQKDKSAVNQIWIERAKLERISNEQLGCPQVNNAIVSESDLDENGNKYYDIEWHDAFFTSNGSSEKNILFTEFKVIFDKEISSDARLHGSMTLRVPALVSGLKRIEYYSALGQRVRASDRSGREIPQELITKVQVDFNIALAKMVLSTLVAVPGTPIEKLGPPSPQRLKHILDCFHSYSKDEIVIDRVVESQPQLGDESAQTGRWHWQIFGKRYHHHIIPVTFHIVMYGSGGQGHMGRTRIETAIISNVDENTVEQVEVTRSKVREILNEALQTEPQ